jgi:hypothetical protein
MLYLRFNSVSVSVRESVRVSESRLKMQIEEQNQPLSSPEIALPADSKESKRGRGGKAVPEPVGSRIS